MAGGINMATARVKFTGFKLIEVPDYIANSSNDEDIDDFIDKKLEELDTGDFEVKAEFEDWW
jgi:hypothetical protein